MTTFFIILFISLLASGMQLTWPGDTEVDMKKETEEERKNE